MDKYKKWLEEEGTNADPNYKTNAELLPCPFCKGEAEISLVHHNSVRQDGWFIECPSDICPVLCYVERGDKEDAIKAWNQRK